MAHGLGRSSGRSQVLAWDELPHVVPDRPPLISGIFDLEIKRGGPLEGTSRRALVVG